MILRIYGTPGADSEARWRLSHWHVHCTFEQDENNFMLSKTEYSMHGGS